MANCSHPRTRAAGIPGTILMTCCSRSSLMVGTPHNKALCAQTSLRNKTKFYPPFMAAGHCWITTHGLFVRGRRACWGFPGGNGDSPAISDPHPTTSGQLNPGGRGANLYSNISQDGLANTNHHTNLTPHDDRGPAAARLSGQRNHHRARTRSGIQLSPVLRFVSLRGIENLRPSGIASLPMPI